MRVDQPLSSVRHWPGMRSEYAWLPPDGRVTRTKAHQIGVSFSAHHRVVHEMAGRTRYLAVPAGAVFSTGAHEMRWGEVREPTEALELYPDLSVLRDVVDPAPVRAVEIRPVVAADDAVVRSIAAVLKRAHVHGRDLDPLHSGALAELLLGHLAEHYCRPRPRPRTRERTGRLAPPALDRVARLVDERLDEPLSLGDLAAAARLSVHHFARTFRNTTGQPPHTYVTTRRMERAKELLLRTRLSVPEVAYAIGLSNVGHFRRLFRRYTGFTPSDLRPR
jgi:AraC family transcriptional regulator